MDLMYDNLRVLGPILVILGVFLASIWALKGDM
jgi:hypothetical protein